MYGKPPYKIIILHGGPGAPGQIAPICRYFQDITGIIEPLLLQKTIEDQIKHIYYLLEEYKVTNAILIGHSWGAMLAYLFTQKFPTHVTHLVLIGSAVFDRSFADQIMKTRLSKLTKTEVDEMREILMKLSSFNQRYENEDLETYMDMMMRVDSYELYKPDNDTILVDLEVFNEVWGEASSLRSENKLLSQNMEIVSPITIIHGDNDPHPIDGILNPIRNLYPLATLKILTNCGHYPWLEKHAHKKFYAILEQIIQN